MTIKQTRRLATLGDVEVIVAELAEEIEKAKQKVNKARSMLVSLRLGEKVSGIIEFCEEQLARAERLEKQVVLLTESGKAATDPIDLISASIQLQDKARELRQKLGRRLLPDARRCIENLQDEAYKLREYYPENAE